MSCGVSNLWDIFINIKKKCEEERFGELRNSREEKMKSKKLLSDKMKT